MIKIINSLLLLQRLVHEYEKNIKQQNMTPDEFRIYMKKRGEAAPTTFEENEIDISSTSKLKNNQGPVVQS